MVFAHEAIDVAVFNHDSFSEESKANQLHLPVRAALL